MVPKKNKTGLYFSTGIFCLLLFVLPGILHALPPNKILDSRFTTATGNGNGETLTLTLKQKPRFKYFVLPGPYRIVLDIYDTFLPGIRRARVINSEKIQTIRMAQNTQNRTRIVLDMKQKAFFSIKPQKSSHSSRYRLILHVTSPITRLPRPHPQKMYQKESPLSGSLNAISRKIPGKNALDIKRPLYDTPSISKSVSTDAVSSQKFHEIDVVALNSELPADVFNIQESSDLKNTFIDENQKSFFSVSGSIQTRGAMDTLNNQGNEHSTTLRNRTILKIGYKNQLMLSALSDYLYFGNDNPIHDYDLDFYEAYFTLPVGSATISLGKKILRWGKTDQISPVDTINPEDFREFIIPDYEDRKIPVWMADLAVNLGWFTLEGVYIPKFEPARQNYFGSDWGVYSHMKEDILDSSLPGPVKDYVNNIKVHKTGPDDSGLNGEVALKATTTINDWDMGITYHYTWEDLPFYSSFPIKNISTNGSMEGEDLSSALGSAVLTNEKIEIEYLRSHIIGFEFETTLGDYGIRGEAAWRNRQSFLTSDLTSVRKSTLFYIIGADYSGMDWYVNVQLSHSHIFDHDNSILYFKEDTVSLLGEITRKLNSEWLKASLYYSITLNDDEYYLSPRLICTYITNFELIIGAHIFEGDPATFIGRFDGNDQLFVDITYHF